MDKILLFLSGKKTTVAVIIMAIVAFGVGRGWIATDVSDLVSAIMLALGLTANVATAKMYGKIYGK